MTRRLGLVEHARDLGAYAHVCWRFDDPGDFRTRAREFLAEGLELGQRVGYHGSGEVDMLVRDLRGIDGIDAAMASGAARAASLDTIYPIGTVIDPVKQVRAYARATDEAMAAGFTGLRVVTDATALVRTPRQVEAFAQYEYLVDHYMAAHPFSALCSYNGAELDDQTIAQIVCMHPATNVAEVRLRLHAPSATGCVAALGGQLDVANRELFELALERIDPRPDGDGALVIDGAGLTFMDHNSLIRLIEQAVRHAAILVLRTSWPGAARISATLNLPNVRIAPAG